MVTGNLETTNLLLAIMAAVSVLEALVLIGIVVGGLMLYRRAMQTIRELEARRIDPIAERVNEILADVKGITERVVHQTDRVDHAISGTIERVDETAERVKSNVRAKANRAVGVVRGIRAAIVTVLNGGSRRRPPQTAAGPV